MKTRYSAGHIAVVFYTLISLVFASAVFVLSSTRWSSSMRSLLGPVSAGIFVLYTASGLFISFITTYIIEHMKRFGHLPGSFHRALREMRDVHPFSLAFSSSIAEELVFRGVGLYFLGIWGQGILFGLAHWPRKKNMYIWPVWAFFIGVMLGYITFFTKTLWSAVAIHFTVNFYSMMQLRRYKKYKK